jgi:hypothetical protein
MPNKDPNSLRESEAKDSILLPDSRNWSPERGDGL